MTDRRETTIRRRMERHQRICLWENDIRSDRLEAAVREALDRGRPIVALVARMGTTDPFGIHDRRSRGPPRRAGRGLPARIHAARPSREPSSAGLGRCSTTTTSRRTFSGSGRARCGRSRRRVGASQCCTGPSRSASTSTRLASRRRLQLVPGPRSGPHAALPHAAGNRCPTCSGAASAIRGGVHAGDVARRGGSAGRLCQPAPLRASRPPRPPRPTRRDGGGAARAPRWARLDHGAQRRRAWAR